MTPEREILRQNLVQFDRFDGSYWAFVRRKSGNLDFFKVVLELFRHCFQY